MKVELERQCTRARTVEVVVMRAVPALARILRGLVADRRQGGNGRFERRFGDKKIDVARCARRRPRIIALGEKRAFQYVGAETDGRERAIDPPQHRYMCLVIEIASNATRRKRAGECRGKWRAGGYPTVVQNAGNPVELSTFE